MTVETTSNLSLRSIIHFLGFQSAAILQVAANRHATWVGLLFVLSAGFAREYDGEYLLAEPWHVAVPLVASVIGCLLLTSLVWLLAWRRQIREIRFAETFRCFLNLYWMTAPLAWVYAIPVERLLPPASATTCNLVFLGIVATWRVALMIRCVGVLYGANVFAAMAPVLLFSTSVAWVALRLVPSPVFMIMGGVRLSESEQIISATRLLLEAGCLLTTPVWLLCYLVLLASRERWRWSLAEISTVPQGAARGVWFLVLASLLVWLPVLPVTQAEQRLRWRFETLLRGEKVAEACELARSCQRTDLPPHWDAPPRVGYGEEHPALLPTLIALHVHEAPGWLWEIYQDKMGATLGAYGPMSFRNQNQMNQLSDEQVVALVAMLQDVPRGKDLGRWLFEEIEDELRGEGQVQIRPARRAALEQLQQFVQENREG